MRIFRQAMESIGGARSRDRSKDQNDGVSPEIRTNSVGPTFHINKKYQTPDFLFQSPKSSFQHISTPTNRPRTNSLSKNFFSMLSSLETKLSIQKNRSLELIDTLVSMYKQCAEYYDSQQDPIKYYFVDKIQIALADAETWNVMNKMEDKIQSMQNITKKHSEHDSDEVFHDIDDTVNQIHRNIESLITQRRESLQVKEESKSTGGSHRGSLLIQNQKPFPPPEVESEEDHMRNNQRARSKKVTIIKKVQAETEQSSLNMNNMMSTYQNSVEKTDSIIKDDLQSQENTLLDRLKRRGHKQQMQRKMGHSHTTGVLEAPSHDLEKFLSELDKQV